MDKSTEFKYSSLSGKSDTIRLLRLLPGKDDGETLQCQLFEYNLQESDKATHLYEALSYVWGCSVISKFIIVNSQILGITRNLYVAFLRLRDRKFPRIIWVDAVCINQKSNNEKQQQIPLIPRIYSQATRVVIWLGEAADNSDKALEEIRRSGSKKSVNSSNDEGTKQAVLKLLERAWFRRIWVSEETLDSIHRYYSND
jgi:heterokaryon incompatibility protein (HET)